MGSIIQSFCVGKFSCHGWGLGLGGCRMSLSSDQPGRNHISMIVFGTADAMEKANHKKGLPLKGYRRGYLF